MFSYIVVFDGCGKTLPHVHICRIAPGADPGFFVGGGAINALVPCSTPTPLNDIVFFLAEYQLY